MSIDWFTFIAQILNFLLLVWLLKHFLYGPIINAMQQREARIAAEITDAQDAQKAANVLQVELQAKLQEQKNSRDELHAAAGKEVDVWRKLQLDAAQAEVDAARTQWYDSLQREQHTMIQQLQLDVTQQATSLCQHLLTQLADQQLQTHIVRKFLARLSEYPETDSAGDNLMAGDHSLVIESSHDLNQQEQVLITEAILDLGAGKPPTYQVNPQLICGIQLRSPGCKLAWNVDAALDQLDLELADSIQRLIPMQPQSRESEAEELQAQ